MIWTRSRWLLASAFLGIWVSAHVSLGQPPITPSVDLRRSIDAAQINTGPWIDTGVFWVKWTRYFRDRVRLTPSPLFSSGDIGGLVYLNDDIGLTGFVQATTVYGWDVDANASDLFLSGFTAADPELLFSDEMYLGATESWDAMSLGAIPVGELAGNPAFANLDTSFIVGDPLSVIYAFQATIPISGLEVPEPISLFTCGLALCLVVVSARR